MKRTLNGLEKMRKYPDHETFAVGDLVLVYHPLGSVLNSPSRKIEQKLGRTIKNTNCPRQNTLFVF